MKVYTGSAWVTAYVSGTDFAALTGATFTGNVTVPNLITTGNVDGRDVSSDGQKLDFIEAGATNTADPAITTNGSTPSLASGITAAEVRSLIGAGTEQSTTFGAVGTYMFAYYQRTSAVGSSTLVPGTNFSGSGLRPAGFRFTDTGTDNKVDNSVAIVSGNNGTVRPALSGTWRSMGQPRPYSNTSEDTATLFVRIS